MSINEVEILRAACCIAALDREVCEKEKVVLEQLRQRIGVGRVSFEAMLDRARNDPNYYQEQFKLAMVDPDLAMKTLFQLAVANHRITLEERVILQHFAEQKLGMERGRFEQLLDAAERHVQRRTEGAREADAQAGAEAKPRGDGPS